jgi:glycosyltransferase involved in cell wall biosynthesis
MKFLIILPSIARGGVEEYALKVAKTAVSKGWEVHVAFPYNAETASLVQNFQSIHARYHRLEVGEGDRNRLEKVLNVLPRFCRALALLLKLKPTVVQTVLPWFDMCLGTILACGLLKIPTLVRFGLVPDQVCVDSWRIRLCHWARARNQKWLTISENNRKLISEAYQIPHHEISRIYNGASTFHNPSWNKSRSKALVRHKIRQELGFPEETQIVLTVGRLNQQKGYADLIPAIPHIIKEFPDVRFVWVGNGDLRSQLQAKIREYGVGEKVWLLGYRPDVPDLLQASDLFLLPTHYEGGQSFALAEAMAFSLPIVASTASGIPEVVKPAVHGLLFRVGDSCDILEALRWALRNPDYMQTMAANAQQRSLEFSEERMLQETLNLIQTLANPDHSQSTDNVLV